MILPWEYQNTIVVRGLREPSIAMILSWENHNTIVVRGLRGALSCYDSALWISQHYHSEGFKDGPWLGPHFICICHMESSAVIFCILCLCILKCIFFQYWLLAWFYHGNIREIFCYDIFFLEKYLRRKNFCVEIRQAWDGIQASHPMHDVFQRDVLVARDTNKNKNIYYRIQGNKKLYKLKNVKPIYK